MRLREGQEREEGGKERERTEPEIGSEHARLDEQVEERDIHEDVAERDDEYVCRVCALHHPFYSVSQNDWK